MKTKILSILALLLMTVTQGAWAQETLTVFDGTGTSQHIPMHGYDFDSYTKSECIIPASELTAMEGGTITAITFYVKEVDGMNSTFSPANQKVFLKEVSGTTLSSYSGMTGATVVFDGTLPMPTTGGYTISFSQGYTYNGGNLLIGVYNDAKGLYNVVTWYGNNNQSDRVSAYGYNYNSLDNVGFTAQHFLPKTTFTYTPAPFSGGSGTQASPYLIASTTDWNNLVTAVNGGETYSGKYFKMTANVGTVSTWMTGTFSGTFDGYGNTLTVGYSATTNNCAPFGYLNGTVQNLKVAGNISTSKQYAGGLAAWVKTGHTANVTNCRVAATINSTYSGDGSSAGFVAYVDGRLNVTGCAFTGTLAGSNAYAWGGFVSYNVGMSVITNCLFAPASVTANALYSATVGRNGGGTLNFATNFYYTQKFNTAQGMQARTIAAGDYVSSLSVTKGDATATYDVSGITVYSGGIDFNDGSTTTFYGGSGQSVSLALTHETPSGYWFKQYAVDKGTIASETTNTPTLTMPAANSTANDVVTISAEYDPLAGEGTEASPYLIASTTDWNNLSTAVNGGETYSGNYFKMTANVGTVSTTVGTSANPFNGTFDGNGHTLNVNISNSNADTRTAPFAWAGGSAVIKNLHVTGSLTNTARTSGIVGSCYATTQISSCRVSATISGGNHTSGISISGGQITNCLFDGKINGTGSTAGFATYVAEGTKITNCLFKPQSGSSIPSNQGCFYTSESGKTPTFDNCYYTSTAGGTAQGTDGSGMTAAQLVENLGPSNWKVVDGNAIPKVHPNLSGEGTEASPYLIASTTDWNNLVSAVNGGETYSGNYFKMTANVGTVSTWMTGTFSGTFDGYGNTLTVDYSATTEKCAPFGTLNGATIQNLKVAGSISSNQRFIAGIAAWCSSTGNNVTNCLVSATINSSYSGNAADGGLVSLVDDGASLNVTGCAFAGKLLTTNGTTSCGGIVGWRRSSGTVTITNCLYAPTSATGSETWIASADGENGNANFCRWNSSEPTITNCYYTTDFSSGIGLYTAQGLQARSISAGDYVSTLSVTKGDGTEYDVSGITVYSGGIDFNDGSTTTFYGGSGQSVSLALTAETRSGYHFKQYAASQGTLSDETTDTPTLTMPAANSTANDVVTILAEYDPFSGGTGTSVNPYQIASTADWNLLVSNVNAGETYSGNYFKMTANVGTVSTWMTGDMTTTGIFSGHFDGDGHTLTVNYSSDTQYCHPFGFLRGATIENLHVTGNITTSQTYAAGLAGRALSNSTNYITNCLVSTNITSTRSGTANICGVVMSVQANATLYIEGCAFTGSITSSNGTDNGGFSEWVTAGGTFSATNCLFAPSSVTDENLANSATFCRNGGTFSGCYYTRTLGTAQGTKAYSITGGNYVTVANAGAATATVYNVSGITSYGTGIQYGGVLYGGNGDAVSLTLTAPEHDGYGFVYSADNGTVTGNGNPYTLTMVDANAIINVKYSASKAINKYTSDENGWYLIASPIETVNPQDVANMTSESNTFDIYRFNQNPTPTMVDEVSQYLEWENWKQANPGETEPRHFNLESGRGYLYANSEDVTLTFTGTPYSGEGVFELEWSDSNPDENMRGWNLVGNPFGVTATIDKAAFYRMNDTHTDVILAESTAIAPMEGIFVYAEEEGSSVTFSTQAPSKGHIQKPESEQVVLNLSHDRGSVIDRAIVRMGEGQTLPKFQIRENSTKLYIPQGTEEYAIVSVGNVGEMPVNFKAKENGNYTISVNPENVEMNYLHLIDNMTGADVDLLQTPSYTFNATTTDYESRFKLVFCTGSSTSSETFAFCSNGNWIISNEGQATLQVIDVTGRILSSETVNGSVSKAINAVPGVYMLRLINGDNVKVQKIVVR